MSRFQPESPTAKRFVLRGQGERSSRRGPAGDLLVTVRVAPHHCYRRQDRNLEVIVPVTLTEAANGAKVDVPTPKGTISLTIPPGTSSGKRLRVRGLGVETPDGKKGDLFAEVQIVLPENLDETRLQLLQKVEEGRTRDPPRETHMVTEIDTAWLGRCAAVVLAEQQTLPRNG